MRLLISAILAGLLAGCGAHAPTPSPTPPSHWNTIQLRPQALIRLDKLVARYQRTKDRYAHVTGLRRGGMPAPVIFGVHYREADNAFGTHLANGDPLTHRTIHVPKGRIPNIPPPYTWEVGAEDALYVDRHEDRINWRSRSAALREIENYNGGGYRKRGLPSPYVYSGTTIYTRGKYVADGRFDPVAVDSQLGVAAILKRMQDRGVQTPF